MPCSGITAHYLWGPLQKVRWHCLGGVTGLKLVLTNMTYSLQQSCTTADNHNLYVLTSPHLKLWPYFLGRKVNQRNAVHAAVEVPIQDWRSHQVQATLKTFYWSNNQLFIYSFFKSCNVKNPWGLLNSVETPMINVIFLVSLLLYTLGYTEGCTCLMTKSFVLQNYGKLFKSWI